MDKKGGGMSKKITTIKKRYLTLFSLGLSFIAHPTLSKEKALAPYQPGYIIKENCSGNSTCLIRLSERGSPTANYVTAQKLWEKRQYKKSLHRLKQASQTGNYEAEYLLALAYEKGLGTDPHPKNALRLLADAAYHGVTKALLHVGTLYETGNFIPKDNSHAYAWLSLARDQQSIEATKHLKKLVGIMSSDEIKKGESLIRKIKRESPYLSAVVHKKPLQSPFKVQMGAYSKRSKAELPH